MESNMSELIITMSTILTIIGALNWGLVGAFKFNLVSYLFGEFSNVSRAVYVLVGISGVVLLLSLLKML